MKGAVITRSAWRVRQHVVPAAVLLAGILLSAFVLDSVFRDIQRNRMSEFERHSDELSSRINDTLETQQYLLMGMRSLHDGAEPVGRQEFQAYLDSIDMEESFPAVYAVSWVPRVPRYRVSDFLQSVRSDTSLVKEGYPDFTIKPLSYATEHHVLTYLYPMELNEWMLGFDLSASADRLLTVEHARDSGEFAASPPLVMSVGNPLIKGFLLVLPTYGGFSPENLAQRRQYYRGMLTAIFRYEVLLESFNLDEFSAIAIRDTTDVQLSDHALSLEPFYRTGQDIAGSRTLYRTIKVADREWQLAVSLTPDAYAQLKSSTVLWIIAFCALAITLASTWLTIRLVGSRNRALQRAGSLTQELSLLKQCLHSANDDLRQFAYATSHDMQIPVRDIDLSITLLDQFLASHMTPPVRDNLQHLRDASSRLHRLAENLLELWKADKQALQLQSIDLNQVLGRVQERLAPLLNEAGADVTVGALPHITGDREQLEQLMTSLLSNAMKYRSSERDLTISVQARRVEAQWHISFADNGIGIEARFHDKVFGPFQRLHQHDDIVGTGLGLRICQQIVESHDGQIFIETSSDAGSTFVISLPAQHHISQQAA